MLLPVVAHLPQTAPASPPARFVVCVEGDKPQTLVVETTLLPTGGRRYTAFVPFTAPRTTDTLSVEIDDRGKLTRAKLASARGGGWDATATGSGALSIRKSETSGDLAVDAPLLTLQDALFALGRRLDPKSSAPQSLARVLFRGERPTLQTLTFARLGDDTLTLSGRTVKSAVWRVAIDASTDRETSGKLWLGPSGEILKAGPPFLGVSLTALAPLARGGDGTFRIGYEPSQTIAARPVGGGFELTLRSGGVPNGTASTDFLGRPLAWENDWQGRKFSANLARSGNVVTLRWRLESSPPTLASAPDGVFTPLHLLRTDLWETDDPVTAPRRIVLCLFGRPEPEEATLERLPDDATPAGGIVRRYKLTGKTLRYELITDGKRLIRLTSPDGLTIERVELDAKG